MEESEQCIIEGCTNRRRSKGKNRSRSKKCQSCDRSEETKAKIRAKAKEHYATDEVYRDKQCKRGAGNNRAYRQYCGDSCIGCGFIPIDKCQLDVDHIDGDHKNNNPNNLQTLCANCHRLKTYKPDLFVKYLFL